MGRLCVFLSLVFFASCEMHFTGMAQEGSLKFKRTKPDITFSSLQWGTNFFSKFGGSGAGDEYIDAAITDQDGNTYIAGETSGNLVETNGGAFEIFIRKISPNGVTLWTKHIGAESAVPGGDLTQWQSCTALALDTSGGLYCAGSTGGSIGEANTNLRSDMLLIKLSASDGTVQWYKQWGAVTMAPSGFDTGMNDWFNDLKFHKGKLYFCASSSSFFAEASNGLYDIIAGRMDLSGNFEWISQVGTSTASGLGVDMSGRDYGGRMALDETHLYCGGSTNGNFSEPNAGGYDFIFVKWDLATGAVVGQKHFGATTLAGLGLSGAGDQWGCDDLEIDRSGNLVCLSYTQGDFSDVDASSSGDILILKLDTSFNLIWSLQLGANTLSAFGGGGSNLGYDWASGLVIGEDNSIYFGGLTEGSLGEANGGLGDAFWGKVSPTGSLLELEQFGTKTPLGGSSNAGNDSCGFLVNHFGKIFCVGNTGGDSFETNAGGRDSVMIRIDER